MREIGQAVGLSSTSSVAHQVRSLEATGYLSKDPHLPRCYALTAQARKEYPASEPGPAASAPVLVPLVGQIVAGPRSPRRSTPRNCCRCPAKWSATDHCSPCGCAVTA